MRNISRAILHNYDKSTEYVIEGNDYSTLTWGDNNSDPKPTEDELLTTLGLIELREVRNKKLCESDWAGNEDIPQETKDIWHPYRQALRDITNTATSLEDVTWPDKP